MNNFLNRLFYFLIVTSSYNLSAQIEDIKEVSAFIFSIKSIDQFIDRFNYDDRDAFKKAYEQAVGTGQGSARKKALLTLFDFERLENEEDAYDGLVEEFIDEIENNDSPIYLDFYDKEWYVKLTMDVLYKSKAYQLDATLYNYSPSKNKSSWSIAAINSEELNWHYSSSKPNILLPPNSEGTDFINFRHMIKSESDHVKNRKKDTSMEPFFKEVMNGNLTLSFIREIEYSFLQLSNYIVVVKEFRRKEENSGWLIDELMKADELKKDNYKVAQLGIKK